MVSKKDVAGTKIIPGAILLIRVGSLFRTEVIQATVKEISPNGLYVKLGDGIEWFAIKTLKILDVLQV
jgi:hypothetical protein